MIVKYIESEKKFYMNGASMNEFQVHTWLDSPETIVQCVSRDVENSIPSETVHMDFVDKRVILRQKFPEYPIQIGPSNYTNLSDAFIVEDFNELVKSFSCKVENKVIEGKKSHITIMKLIKDIGGR